jgi:hypothetical protein
MLLRRMAEMGRLMNAIEEELKAKRLHERLMHALVDGALRLAVRNHTYWKQAEVSNQVAKRDLRALVEHGHLIPKGERRARAYFASHHLKKIRQGSLLPRQQFDPFVELAMEKAEKGP